MSAGTPPTVRGRAPGDPAPRSWLHELLRLIDDDLVKFEVVRARAGTPDVLAPAFLADWLRMTTFQPGLGPVLWSGTPEETMTRLEGAWDRPGVGHVKMTPTGANAARAMDDPPPALRAFYAGRASDGAEDSATEDLAAEGMAAEYLAADRLAADGLAAARLAAEVRREVEAVMSLALVPAGLSTGGRERTG